MDITTQQLRCFVAACEHRHFGRAAAALHLSTSTLSENIATLERRVARKLFVRSARGVAPTEAGQELLPLARTALAAMDKVVEWGRVTRAEPATIRVGLMVSSPPFRALMASATRKLSEMNWEIRHLGFDEGYRALTAHEVDASFVVEAAEPSANCVAYPLWREGCVLVTAGDHRFAGRAVVDLDEILDETFVLVRDLATSRRWLPALTGRSEELRVQPIARTFEEVLELCAAGVGVNIAGASAADTYARPGLAFVPLRGVAELTTYLCLRRESATPAMRRFVALARESSDLPFGKPER